MVEPSHLYALLPQDVWPAVSKDPAKSKQIPVRSFNWDHLWNIQGNFSIEIEIKRVWDYLIYPQALATDSPMCFQHFVQIRLLLQYFINFQSAFFNTDSSRFTTTIGTRIPLLSDAVIKWITEIVKWIVWLLDESDFHHWVGNSLERSQMTRDTASVVNICWLPNVQRLIMWLQRLATVVWGLVVNHFLS